MSFHMVATGSYLTLLQHAYSAWRITQPRQACRQHPHRDRHRMQWVIRVSEHRHHSSPVHQERPAYQQKLLTRRVC